MAADQAARSASDDEGNGRDRVQVEILDPEAGTSRGALRTAYWGTPGQVETPGVQSVDCTVGSSQETDADGAGDSQLEPGALTELVAAEVVTGAALAVVPAGTCSVSRND